MFLRPPPLGAVSLIDSASKPQVILLEGIGQ
jgi:hypothetical protein